MKTIHFLQDNIKHQATVRPTTYKVNRPQALRRNHVFQPFAQPRSFSKCIGNPAMKHAGAGVIWNEV